MLNNKVTYHSFLTSKGNEDVNPFVDFSLNPLLKHIERSANCLIKTKPMISGDENKKGYWVTEIHYHQLYGKHDLAIRMIDGVLDNLKKTSRISINRTPVKTIRGFHPIQDEEIAKSLKYSVYPDGFRHSLLEKYRIQTNESQD